MVTIAQIRAAIEGAISGLRADGSYSLGRDLLFDTWTVSPDSGRAASPRDLTAIVRIGGGVIRGRVWEIPVAVEMVLASFSSVRSASGATDTLTAEDRVHGAAQHILQAVPLAVPGLIPDRYSDPTTDGDWYVVVATFILRI